MINLNEKIKNGLGTILGISIQSKEPEKVEESTATSAYPSKSVGTSEVNKALKKHFFPVARQSGFTKVKGKSCYKYNKSSVFVVSVEAVGKHFSDVTGFTPLSFMCTLGVFFPFIINKYDQEGTGVGYDKDGLPVAFPLHQSLRLQNFNFSKQARHGIANPAESDRKDVWFVERDGSNVEDMVHDLLQAFEANAGHWFTTYENLELAFKEIEKERDCPGKFEKLYYMATELQNEALEALYKAKMS